jgi:hypothetical protein
MFIIRKASPHVGLLAVIDVQINTPVLHYPFEFGIHGVA